MRSLWIVGLCLVSGVAWGQAGKPRAATTDPLETEAFEIARNSGTIIGAATACGVASARAAAVGRQVIAVGTSGPKAVRDRDFRIVHAEAARTAGLRQQNENRPGCDNALAAFKELEAYAAINR